HEHLVGGQHEYRFFFQAEDGIRDRVLSDDEGRHETRQRVEHAARRFSRELASGKHIDRGRRLRYRAILTPGAGDDHFLELLDRKSTRLNSSHSQISYAVFCLKKKRKDKQRIALLMHEDMVVVFTG